MLVLGVDPGKATGWIILEGPDADSLRPLGVGALATWGTCRPHGKDAEEVMRLFVARRDVRPQQPCLVSIERQHGMMLLIDTYGRWLGMAEARGLEVVGVWPASWKPRFIGPPNPRKVLDPATGKMRALLSAEKRAAKKATDEAYRVLAVERFHLPADITPDVAAAAWVAAFAVDEILRTADGDPEPKKPRRRKKRA